MTSVTAWMLCSIMAEAGLPAGVVNMVFGYGATAGEAIVTHPKVIIELLNFYVDTFGNMVLLRSDPSQATCPQAPLPPSRH